MWHSLCMLVVHIDLGLLYTLCLVRRLVIPVYLEQHLAFKVESNFAICPYWITPGMHIWHPTLGCHAIHIQSCMPQNSTCSAHQVCDFWGKAVLVFLMLNKKTFTMVLKAAFFSFSSILVACFSFLQWVWPACSASTAVCLVDLC